MLKIFKVYHKFHINVINDSNALQVGYEDNLRDNILRDNTGDNISKLNNKFSELTGLYWIWKNETIDDFICFEQYARFFDTTQFHDINHNDIVLCKERDLNSSIYEQFKIWHNVSNLDNVIQLIKEKYNEYANGLVVLDSNFISAHNMFIMHKTIFNEYCKFLFGLLKDLNINMKSNEDRVYAFLSERILNIFAKSLEYRGFNIIKADIIML